MFRKMLFGSQCEQRDHPLSPPSMQNTSKHPDILGHYEENDLLRFGSQCEQRNHPLSPPSMQIT